MKQILSAVILYAIFHSGQALASDKGEQAKIFPNYDFAASSRTWNKDPYANMMKRPEVWATTTFVLDISTLAFIEPFNTWAISDPYNIEELKPSDCGDKITRGFEVNTSTIYFTLGRCPEMCSSPPAMR